MPNSLTHKYISDNILDALDEDLKRRILPHKDLFSLGAMGPDILMGLMLSSNKEKKTLGDDLHEEHVFDSLFRAAEYLARNHKNDEATLAYYMGYLTHYAADTVVHPYVYDYIDNRMRQKFDPTLNSCLHLIVETEMDTYVDNYCLNGKNANTYWCFKWGKRQQRQVAKYFFEIQRGVIETKWTKKDIRTSFFFVKLLLFLCHRHKNSYFRFTLFQKADKFLKADHLLLSALRPRDLDPRYDYLNFNKQPYGSIYRDVDDCQLVTHSFPEMMDIAKDKGIKLLEAAYEHICGGAKLNIADFMLNYNGTYNIEYKKAYNMPMLPDVDTGADGTYDTIY